MKKGVFVTATDTGVGKTYFACALAEALKKNGCDIGVMKPFCSGVRSDVTKLIKAAGVKDKVDEVNPEFFRSPLAPLAAARLERKTIGMPAVLKKFAGLSQKHDFMIVEGAGGLEVPIKNNYTVVNLIRDFKLPVIVVARAGLGTINHSVLSVKRLRSEGIRVSGIVLSGRSKDSPAERTNPAIVARMTKLPVVELRRNSRLSKKDILKLGIKL
ncbi:MAG TPA: dethiobiotin synthase [Elusimicrobia bacterium]|nr:MAG: dethiobiotin synthase [Elusimicrobia bacterium RIFOXYA12_FULL_49_49]OGS15009.1 MAG: dethiobiotin synthase [Elusimicrobia bacterium RIFOXYA2_FULL_47_53]OGS26056.1 MAG: dethiobiotin synthase [Elusimicrobia bacterium RIFOXYB12_FULL_50_12]OGS29353.1 MAG: dethiobiotin synthase [Elusimicrobia bacterium RIFOXYB2_FULL_46_23]HBU69424.1 dethiobiotin synthase [Elusimicrobiota bacterium]